jgi:hypothetical protein
MITTEPDTKQAPDFKDVRRYLRTIQQREALGQFVKAGWTPVNSVSTLASDRLH